MAHTVLLFLGVMVSSGTTVGQQHEPKKVVVTEGDDAVLPCSISPIQNLERERFDWSKDGGKEVFLYDNGDAYNNGHSGQDPQFTGRVSHFPEQLKDGDASIKIQRTTVADSGNYTCEFPHDKMQTSVIELLVECILKDRTKEKKDGACPKPSIDVNQARDTSVLQCEIEGAFPKPDIKWQDSAGTDLDAVVIKSTEEGGRFYITLQTTVNQSGRYICNVTQLEICHQTQRETNVFISGKADAGSNIWPWFGGLVLGALCLAAVQWLLVKKEIIIIQRQRGTLETQNRPLEMANGSAAHGSHPTAGDPASEPLQPISDV